MSLTSYQIVPSSGAIDQHSAPFTIQSDSDDGALLALRQHMARGLYIPESGSLINEVNGDVVHQWKTKNEVGDA